MANCKSLSGPAKLYTVGKAAYGMTINNDKTLGAYFGIIKNVSGDWIFLVGADNTFSLWFHWHMVSVDV